MTASSARALGIIALVFTVAAYADTRQTDQLVSNAWYWQLRGRDDLAAEAWEKVLLASPAQVEALASLGNILAHQGKISAARNMLARLEEVNPAGIGVLQLRRALAIGDRYGEELEKARATNKAGRIEDAVNKYRQLFGCNTPPGYLALEFYQTLAGTKAGWEEARSNLSALSERLGGEEKIQLALARLLTWREHTRVQGINMLRLLSHSKRYGGEALAAWRLALTWLAENKQSTALFNQYLAEHPEDAQISKRLGRIIDADRLSREIQAGYDALDHGELENAERIFGTLIRQNPLHAQVMAGAGLVALQKKQYAKARKFLNRARSLAPGHRDSWEHPLRVATFLNLMDEARAAQASGKRGEREAKLLAAAGVGGEQALEAELELARLYLETKQITKAERWLHKATRSQSSDFGLLRALVEVLVQAGWSTQASHINERLAAINPDGAFQPGWIEAERLRRKASESQGLRQIENARLSLMAAQQADPDNIWVRHDLANVLLELGEVSEAEEQVRILLKHRAGEPAFELIAARVLAAQGARAKAIEILDSLPKPLEQGAWQLRRELAFQIELDSAVGRIKQGNYLAGRKQLTQLQRLGAGQPSFVAEVAQAWADVGEVDRGVNLLRDTVIRLHAPAISLRLKLASLLLQAGNDSELSAILFALDDLAEREALTPLEERLLSDIKVGRAVKKADIWRDQGETDLAAEELESILRERPDDTRLLLALGRVYQSTSSHTEARAVYRKILRENGNDFEAREGAIYCAVALEDWDDAQHLREEILESNPNNPRVYLLAAHAAVAAGDDRAAIDSLHRALVLMDSTRPANAGDSLMGSAQDESSAQWPGENKQNLEAQQSLRSEIEEQLARIRARHQSRFDAGMATRWRDGEAGLNSLAALQLPLSISIPVNYAGSWRLTVVPTSLDAGVINLSTYPVVSRFGSSISYQGPTSQQARGVALGIGWESRDLRLQVGSTPLGFKVQTVEGSLRWSPRLQGLALTLDISRLPVTDSLLSWAGTVDPASNKTWGAVMRQGVRINVASTGERLTYAYVDYYSLNGRGVTQNNEFGLGVGTAWKVMNWKNNLLNAGLSLSALGYQHNLSGYTLGQGGYFSPQLFAHAGIPVSLKGAYGLFSWNVCAELGLNWFHEESMANTASTTGARGGVAFDLRSDAAYRISPTVETRLKLGYHRAQDYQEAQFILALGYTFSSGEGRARAANSRDTTGPANLSDKMNTFTP